MRSMSCCMGGQVVEPEPRTRARSTERHGSTLGHYLGMAVPVSAVALVCLHTSLLPRTYTSLPPPAQYDTVAEGIAATVRIYIDLIRRLLRGDFHKDSSSGSSNSTGSSSSGSSNSSGSSGSSGSSSGSSSSGSAPAEVFVHPVPPVLNETRPLVTAFAAALREGLAAAVVAEPEVLGGRLHYLDFFDELLLQPGADGSGGSSSSSGGSSGSGSGSSTSQLESAPGQAGAGQGPRLRPELAFDGTHLSPAYVEVMDAALARVV
mgnify:CR=1 FL=1